MKNILLYGLGALIACSLASQAAAQASEPIVTLEIPGEGSVKFYESAPGTLLTIKQGNPNSPLARNNTTNPVLLYEQLAGEPAPEKLVAAAAASRPEGAEDASLGATPKTTYGLPTPTPIDREAFRQEFCYNQRTQPSMNKEMLLDKEAIKFEKKGLDYLIFGIYAARGPANVAIAEGNCGGCQSSWNGRTAVLSTSVGLLEIVPEGHFISGWLQCTRNCSIGMSVNMNSKGTDGDPAHVGDAVDMCFDWYT